MSIRENRLYIEDVESVLNLNCDFLKLKGKTILITGATGLIGTVLKDMFVFLAEKFELNLTLLLVSRSYDENIEKRNSAIIKTIKNDVSDKLSERILKEKIDYIIHLASNTHPNQYAEYPVKTIKTNVIATDNLLSLAEKNINCRFLFASSVEIYGNASFQTDEGFSEKEFGYIDCNTLRACYNESKRLGETLCQAYKGEKKLDVVIARLCRCYGPTLKRDDTKALSQFIFNGIAGKNIVLKSEGNQYFSYLYSADAASALIFLLLKGINGEAYNVSDRNSNIYLKNLADLIASYCKTKVIFEIPSETEQIGYSKAQNAVINTQKLNSLGWKAQVGIEEGVKRTIEVMRGEGKK